MERHLWSSIVRFDGPKGDEAQVVSKGYSDQQDHWGAEEVVSLPAKPELGQGQGDVPP